MRVSNHDFLDHLLCSVAGVISYQFYEDPENGWVREETSKYPSLCSLWLGRREIWGHRF